MTMELASVRVVRKPWGKTDLRPFSELGHDGSAVGELWFQRADPKSPEPALLLKLLFTEEPLSIQVHPDDAFAHSIGLPHGKTEAWYVLAAENDGRIALGLKRTLTPPQLRAAIEDGSIADLVVWQPVRPEQAILVPAGTIHAIGAGLVIAEIQQRGDTTFRLFDYGRRRELQLDSAVGASAAGPAAAQSAPAQLSEGRQVVARSPYFVLEQIDLPANSHWEINAAVETWVLLLSGEAKFGLLPVVSGDAVFIEGHRVALTVGDHGAKGLMAYVASTPIDNQLVGRNGIPLVVIAERVPELGLSGPNKHPLPTLPWGVPS